jgi:hypothetical protein
VTATATARTTSVTTTTTTTTTIVREYKRQASVAGSAASSRTTPALLASLQSYAANVARTACSCIAMPVTTTTVRPDLSLRCPDSNH